MKKKGKISVLEIIIIVLIAVMALSVGGVVLYFKVIKNNISPDSSSQITSDAVADASGFTKDINTSSGESVYDDNDSSSKTDTDAIDTGTDLTSDANVPVVTSEAPENTIEPSTTEAASDESIKPTPTDSETKDDVTKTTTKESERTTESQASTQKSTEEKVTQKPTETEKPTQKPTETEAPTQKPTETEKPTQKPTETEKSTQKPTETEEPTQKPTETEKPTQKPTETEKPTQKPTETEAPTKKADTETVKNKSWQQEILIDTDDINTNETGLYDGLYSGEWSDGKPNGKGTFVSNKSKYYTSTQYEQIKIVGVWKDGQLQGQASVIQVVHSGDINIHTTDFSAYSSTHIFVGNFKKNVAEGTFTEYQGSATDSGVTTGMIIYNVNCSGGTVSYDNYSLAAWDYTFKC